MPENKFTYTKSRNTFQKFIFSRSGNLKDVPTIWCSKLDLGFGENRKLFFVPSLIHYYNFITDMIYKGSAKILLFHLFIALHFNKWKENTHFRIRFERIEGLKIFGIWCYISQASECAGTLARLLQKLFALSYTSCITPGR